MQFVIRARRVNLTAVLTRNNLGFAMPIYEYRCPGCGHEWSRQELLEDHARTRVACPKCGAEAEQVLSAFFAKTIRKS